MVDPQVVSLVQGSHHMTVAVSGAQTKVTRDHDNFEVIQEHDSAETAAREFARWLGRASQEGWDLDPEVSPNPTPLEPGKGFEPTPEEVRLWREISRTEEDVLIVDLRRLRGRQGSADAVLPAHHPSWQGVCEELGKANPPKLRIKGASRTLIDPLPLGILTDVEELTLGSGRARSRGDDHGDVGWVLQAMPALTSLEVSGVFEFESTAHAALRSLALHGSPSTALSLENLSKSDLPALTSLTLDLSCEEEEEELDDDFDLGAALVSLLASPPAQTIEELTLIGDVYAEDLLELVVHNRPPALKRLTLPGEFSDVVGTVEFLKSNAEALKGLALDLNTDSWEDEELAYLPSEE